MLAKLKIVDKQLQESKTPEIYKFLFWWVDQPDIQPLRVGPLHPSGRPLGAECDREHQGGVFKRV